MSADDGVLIDWAIRPPSWRSKLRLVAGSDAVCIYHPVPKPNAFYRWVVKTFLNMEWCDA